MRVRVTLAVCLAAALVHGCADDSEVSREAMEAPDDDLAPKLAGSGVEHTQAYPSVGVVNSCTGTLITSRTVLTAAHCVPNAGWAIHAKQFRLNGRKYAIHSAIRHPAYRNSESYDLGLYILKTEVKEVIPARIGSAAPTVGQGFEQAGMGSTGGKGNYHMKSRYVGTTEIAEVSGAWFSYRGDVRNCSGDSGGPAFVEGAIIGTVSSGDGNNCSASIGWNSRVDVALDWIENNAVGTVVVTHGGS